MSNLTVNVEKEIKLRQDVLTGKESVESMIQKKLDDMTNEMNILCSDASIKIGAQMAELRKMDTSGQSANTQI